MAKDNVLIGRAQSGDDEAFAELMRAHYAHVYGVVIKIVNNPHDAEEVVQETFFSAYRGLPQLEDRRKFKSWLTEIARNRARDRLRKQRMDTILIDEVSKHTLQTPDTVSDELIRAEQRELIRRAMEALPQKDREIACAYYLEGARYDELIQAHGLSYKAISFRLSRAKQRLIKRLRSMLTVVFLPPATTLKQIYSGGLIAMKIGTAPKITVSAIGIFYFASVLLHVISLLLVIRFLNPERDHSVDDAVSLHFFDINNPRTERTPTHIKRMVPIRKQMGGSPAQPNRVIRPIQQAIPTVHNPPSVVNVGAENIGVGHGVGDGDGGGLNGGSFLAEPVERLAPVSVKIRKVVRTGGDVLPPKRTEMNRSIPPLGTDISSTQPSEDLTNPTDMDKITDRDKVDVIFIISAQWGMDKYFGYAVSLVEREIQRYKESGKDYHVGIIKSRLQELAHQIEYLPLSSDLDTALETAREIQRVELSSDILLNAIRYALERCVFRPNAARRIIVVGNDMPMRSGYSPLSIIELCLKKRVTLDIHGADKQVGPLLAEETGGRWYPALGNSKPSHGWAMRFTLDNVVEGKLSNWRLNK